MFPQSNAIIACFHRVEVSSKLCPFETFVNFKYFTIFSLESRIIHFIKKNSDYSTNFERIKSSSGVHSSFWAFDFCSVCHLYWHCSDVTLGNMEAKNLQSCSVYLKLIYKMENYEMGTNDSGLIWFRKEYSATPHMKRIIIWNLHFSFLLI